MTVVCHGLLREIPTMADFSVHRVQLTTLETSPRPVDIIWGESRCSCVLAGLGGLSTSPAKMQ